MANIEVSVVMNVPLSVAQATSEDPSIRTDWYVGMQDYEAGAGYPAVGVQSKWHLKASGIPVEATEEIIEYAPGEYIKFTFESQLIKGVMTWTLQDMGGDTTQLTVSTDYELFGGVIGQALNAAIVEKQLIADLQQSLENLKGIAEAR